MKKLIRMISFFCIVVLLLGAAPLQSLLDVDLPGGKIGLKASAASKSSEEGDYNVAYTPVTGSYETMDLAEPLEIFFEKESFYINIHVGKDFYVKQWSLQIEKATDDSSVPYKTYSMTRTGYGAYWAQKISGFPVGSYLYSFKITCFLRSSQTEVTLDEEGGVFVITSTPKIKFTPSSIKMNKDSIGEYVRLDISTYWNFSFEQLGIKIGIKYPSEKMVIKADSEKFDNENRIIYLLLCPLKPCKDEKLTFEVENKNNNDSVLSTATLSVTIEDSNHTVTYDYATNGGSSATKEKETYPNGSAVDLSPTAKKNGWTFVGWNTDKNATSKLSSYTMGNNDVTLYAIYKKTITAKFVDYNGTTKRTNQQEATIYNNEKEARIDPPSQGSYSGWSARGWSTSTFSDASPTDKFTISSDTTYYGLYERSLNLSYKANGGSSTPSSATGTQYVNSYSVSSKKSPTIKLASAISRDGYTFDKWAKGSSSGSKYSAGSSITISEDTTMYATWEAVTYTVSYDAAYNGGRSSKSYENKKKGDSVDLSPTASKSGWTFVGWNTDKSATTRLSSLKMSDRDIMLYAIFKKDLTVTFVDYSGSTKRTTERKQTIYNNESSASFSAPSQGQYMNWSACGWSADTDPDALPTKDFTVSENTTYYGLYKRTITLSYNANGGSPTPTSVKGTQTANSYKISATNDPYFRLASAISKSGVSFLGWTKGSTKGTLLNAGDDISLNQDTTMYASFSTPTHTHSWGAPSWKWSSKTAKAVFACKSCGQKREVQASVKTKVEKKATEQANGKTVLVAKVKSNGTVYSAKKSGKAIPKIQTIQLSKTAFVFDGNEKTPKVIIRDSQGNTLKKNKDFKVKFYGDRTECGSYKVKVAFIGKYAGTKTLSYKIVLGQVKGLRQEADPSKMIISWDPVPGADYYEIYRYDARKDSFCYMPTDGVLDTTSVERSDLKNMTLKLKVRAVRETGSGKVVPGDFSKVLTVRV